MTTATETGPFTRANRDRVPEHLLTLAQSLGACLTGIERARVGGWAALSSEDRCWIAQNPSTPVAVLERLSGDADAYVRRYVAQNPSTPVAVLERLSGDADADVRRGVAQNIKRRTT